MNNLCVSEKKNLNDTLGKKSCFEVFGSTSAQWLNIQYSCRKTYI